MRIGLMAAAAAGAVLGSSLCHGVIAPNLVGSPVPTTGGYLWTYQAEAQTGSLVAALDFFTLYDFAGYDPANPLASISVPPLWVATSQLVTPPPPNTAPPDNALLYNITFQYTGPTLVGDLGNFTVFSTYGQVSAAPGFYAGRDHDAAGEFLQFISSYDTPLVPEPASLGLASLGLIAAGARRRRQA